MKDKRRPGTGRPSCADPARVLVVEDEAIIAMDLSATLRRQGCVVIGPAATGEDSIARAGAERPDLVLMDIRLRGPMNGLEAARVIKARWGIPVVFLTAYEENDRPGHLSPENGSPRVIKPFSENDIALVLSRYLPANNN
ncbi:MAG: response regulator [Candidatus Aminicenantales bacterium]|jgi:CheY-like chemotaxis protein